MNVVFVSHCDFQGNSAMHIYSIANVLADLGVRCAVCVPNDASTIAVHGTPKFTVVPYANAYTGPVFPDGAAPDIIHAWTPRELVRKLTERLADVHRRPYVVHLEDNEETILENELDGIAYGDLCRLPQDAIDRMVPEHRSHPVRYKEFLAKAAGVTALMDRLLEFKPPESPGLVFWPGFDEDFLRPPASLAELRRGFGVSDGDTVLVYCGNVHQTNAAEVRSLFLAAQALRRSGRAVTILKTGWNHIADQSWIQEAVASGAVRDLGFLPRAELRSALAVADILVQPGRSDRFNDYRFPSKLPEFFASGKPVILPRTNLGLSVRDGVEALLLEYGNAVEIAEKIESLIADPERAARIGEAGRQFAMRRLRWSKNVPPLKDFYAQTIARSARPSETRGDPESMGAATPAKLIAFYLPQFHPIQENDEAWGKGFTEWTNVARAKPNFEDHYQPQLPADLGFYDLRAPEVLEEQAQLARRYGIYGFCLYYYWFAGRRLLDRPLNNMLQSGRPDFPFCVCWANENWTRNWDGAKDDVLVWQDYSGDSCERFIRDLIPAMRDARYIRVGGAPMLLVYRVNLLPDPAGMARRWREIAAEAGIPALHLCAVQSFGVGDPRPYGFDAAVEFPPHTKRALLNPLSFPGTRPDFEGYLEDYPAIVRNQLALPPPDYPLYRGVMPAWDNTPRRGTKAHILVHSSPGIYEGWLYEIVSQSLRRSSPEPFVFVNAWNEWAEGAYLEPDQKLGRARLEATRSALLRAAAEFAASAKQPERAADAPAAPCDPVSLGGDAERLYPHYPLTGLSYATVSDYCDSFDNLHGLATANGDLKDCQRPWAFKAIRSKVPRKGRLLEIGAGEPLVADLLQQLGHEVWVVDPYDGTGNGPIAFEQYRDRYPKLKFVRSVFDHSLDGAEPESFDCIYSISVLEHVPCPALKDVFAGIRRFLKRDGVTIHAVDHVHRGNGAGEHLAKLRQMIHGFGFEQQRLDSLLAAMEDDTETYYLSAESHNRWRDGVAYDQFPMRVCVSIQIVADASHLPGAG